MDKVSEKGEMDYIQTGYAAVDQKVGGFKRGETYLIAGRILIGQHEFSYNVCANLVEDKKDFPVTVIFSDDEHRGSYQKALDGISSGLYYCENPHLYFDDIYACCKLVEKNIDLIIIDSLKFIKEFANSDNGLKLIQMAKELNCAILVICDLDESIDKRENHIPTLSDVEKIIGNNQFDHIWAVYREDYYYPETTERPLMLDLYILKPNENIIIELVWIEKYKLICGKEKMICSIVK